MTKLDKTRHNFTNYGTTIHNFTKLYTTLHNSTKPHFQHPTTFYTAFNKHNQYIYIYTSTRLYNTFHSFADLCKTLQNFTQLLHQPTQLVQTLRNLTQFYGKKCVQSDTKPFTTLHTFCKT